MDILIYTYLFLILGIISKIILNINIENTYTLPRVCRSGILLHLNKEGTFIYQHVIWHKSNLFRQRIMCYMIVNSNLNFEKFTRYFLSFALYYKYTYCNY